MADLAKLLAASIAHVKAMSPAEREAMEEAQRQSWARAFAPCEHGVLDWEECVDCRRKGRFNG